MTLQEILEAVRAQTGAMRATLRLDRPGEDFPVVAEALAAGARPIAADPLPQRRLPTVRWLIEHRRPLVQPDVASADPAPPQALVDAYGVRAQMLGPVLRAGEVAGWISVHAGEPRAWTPGDVAALERAVTAVERELAAGAGG